jgi:hypothetical protein
LAPLSPMLAVLLGQQNGKSILNGPLAAGG